MNRFVCVFGGQLVTDVIGTLSPPFPNADYWFDSENIIAELKCLSEDKTSDPAMHAAINKLFNHFIDSGQMPDPGPGIFRVQSKRCPWAFQQELYKIFARPIKRRLHKANQQIKATRKYLNRPDAHGLVLLANDGNYCLELNQLMCAVDFALGQNFSSIDSLVVFTENILSNTPITDRHVATWIPASREGHLEISTDFLYRFNEGWARHVGQLIGEDIPIIREVEHSVLDLCFYDQAVSKARK